jgi:serine/threonine protein kinase
MNDHESKRSVQLSTKDSLANYDIICPLGRGGHSFVYKARSRTSLKFVALKVIDITIQKSREQVMNEIRIHGSLSHPHIIRLLDHFHDETYHYLVLEYCEQGELYAYLQSKQGKLPEAEIKVFLSHILEGLMYLENKGIIHRDIKLGNLLLTSSGEIKISDFGLAVNTRSLDANPVDKMSGTPNYIAPEIIRKRCVTPVSDIWSLGCVAYALFEGSLPFEATSTEKTLVNIVKESPAKPLNISKGLYQLIEFMLTKDHSIRPNAERLLRSQFFKDPKPRDELTASTLELESMLQVGDSSLNFSKSKKTSSFFAQLKKESIEGKEKSQKEYPIEIKNRSPRGKIVTPLPAMTTLQRQPSRGPTPKSKDFGLVKTRLTMEAIIDSMKKQPFLFSGKLEGPKPTTKTPKGKIASTFRLPHPEKTDEVPRKSDLMMRPASRGHLSVLNRRVGSFCERSCQSRPGSQLAKAKGLDDKIRASLEAGKQALRKAMPRESPNAENPRPNLGGLLSRIPTKM